jgi:hypothetical protein
MEEERSRGQRSFSISKTAPLLFSSGKLHSPHNSTNHHLADLFRLMLPHFLPFTAPRFGSKNSSLTFLDISDVHTHNVFFEDSLCSFHKRPLPVHGRCLLPLVFTFAPPGIIHKISAHRFADAPTHFGHIVRLALFPVLVTSTQKSARNHQPHDLYNSLLLHLSIHHRVLRATAGSARSHRPLVVVAVIVVVFVNFNFSRCWLRMFLALLLLPLEHGMHRWHLMR